jgi:hypothetical protein
MGPLDVPMPLVGPLDLVVPIVGPSNQPSIYFFRKVKKTWHQYLEFGPKPGEIFF